MSYLKFSENLFLGKRELERFKSFLDDKGFRFFLLANAGEFGLVTDKDRALNNNFLVQSGTNFNTIKFTENSYAIDASGNAINQPIQDNIDISSLTGSVWYWLKISHKYTPNEVGVVSIDANGNMTGVNTKFTDVLRGQATGFPSKVTFTDATLNISEYEVSEVIDDTNAVLAGEFQVENSQAYKVVGTFTPGSIQQVADKDIFQYDGAVYEFVLETVDNTEPAGLVADEEFWIARIKNDGGVLTIQDKRTSLFKTKGLSVAETNESDLTSLQAEIDAINSQLSLIKHGNQWYVGVNETLTIEENQQFYLKDRVLENDGTINNDGEIYLDQTI